MLSDRTKLLLTLEALIGNECYNGNIQNWGPGGQHEGEGRRFRYPVTFVDTKGNKLKRKSPDLQLAPGVAETGYYGFGANQLHIIRGLEKVLEHLERHHGLKI